MREFKTVVERGCAASCLINGTLNARKQLELHPAHLLVALLTLAHRPLTMAHPHLVHLLLVLRPPVNLHPEAHRELSQQSLELQRRDVRKVSPHVLGKTTMESRIAVRQATLVFSRIRTTLSADQVLSSATLLCDEAECINIVFQLQ